MDVSALLWKVLPFALFLAYGAYTILEVFVPSLRSSDFNQWEIDEESRTSIQIMGWRKALSPPRVLASGYLSERAACTVALCIGTVFVASLGSPCGSPIFSANSHTDSCQWFSRVFTDAVRLAEALSIYRSRVPESKKRRTCVRLFACTPEPALDLCQPAVHSHFGAGHERSIR